MGSKQPKPPMLLELMKRQQSDKNMRVLPKGCPLKKRPHICANCPKEK